MASAGETHPGGQALGPVDKIQDTSDALTPSAVNHILMEFLMYFVRALVVLYPVYLTGYLGLSISWVLLCMLMITWWKKNRQWKDARIGSVIDFVDNEKNVIDTELKNALQMASWVNFPDVEKVQWVNKVIEQAWPFIGMYVEKLLKLNIQPAVRASNSALKTFTFTKIHFGYKPVRITGMRAYTHEVDQREVILDLNINFDSDVDIDAHVNAAITAGVKGVKFKGMLRVILEPLVGQSPIVGGVTLFFIRRPTLQINWTGITNLLDSPAFSSLSEDTIMDIIASFVVLPNRMCFPLIDQIKVDQMRFPLPRGVVRVHVLEARDLVAKDTYAFGLVKGKSDPYVTLRVGNRNFKTKTIKENLHPKWNSVYEFVVHEAPGQELEVEVYDEDTDKDDFLGSYNLDLGDVKREKEIDKWFPLEGVPHGDIHFKLQWLSLNTDASLLMKSNDSLACAMLAVYLDNASNLPKDHSELTTNQKHGKHTKEARLTKRNVSPNSYVEVSIDKDVQKSKVVYANKNPVWEQGFTFFVHNVQTQHLDVQVKDPEKKHTLGTLKLPLTRLLNCSNMVLDQRFLLEQSGANSDIKLKATLRILTLEQPPPKIVITSTPNLKQQKPPIKPGASSATPTASTSNQRVDLMEGSTEKSSAQQTQNSLQGPETGKSPSMLNIHQDDSRSMVSLNSMMSSHLDLTEGASYPAALRKYNGPFGEIKLTIRYADLRKKLNVWVIACRNLFPCSENGTDSYVRVYLLPETSWRHRKKTQVKKKTVNPNFDHKLEFDVSVEEAQTRKLDVAVKNNRMFHTRERNDIGKVVLDLSQVDIINGVTDWYELTLPGLNRSASRMLL